jgi:phosphatidylserine decarboxylase
MLTSAVAGGVLALLVAIPLSWKWQLGIARVAVVIAGLAIICAMCLSIARDYVPIALPIAAGLVSLLTLASGTAILLYRFYRDPERQPPRIESAVVSPADGEVLYIRVAKKGILPISTKQGRAYTLTELTRTGLQSEEAVVVGIGMSFMDVHVNRAPISGRVTFQRHFPGRFGSLRSPAMAFENERATTIIEREGIQVAIVQIASRLVRQIVSFVGEGDELAVGDRIGMIRFGSQVDLVLPARDDLQLLIQPGERVWAGESVIAMVGSRVWGSISSKPRKPQTACFPEVKPIPGVEPRAMLFRKSD